MSSTHRPPLPKFAKGDFINWRRGIEERATNTSTQFPSGIAGAVFSPQHIRRLYPGDPPNPGIAPVKPVQGDNAPVKPPVKPGGEVDSDDEDDDDDETDRAYHRRLREHRLLVADHAAELKAHTDFLATIANFKDEVVSTLHPTDLSAISDPYSGMRTVTPAMVMDYMWDKYGRPSATDMANLRMATQKIYTPDIEMDDFVTGINTSYATLAMNSEATNEATKAQYLINSVRSCPIFEPVITLFERQNQAAGSQLYSGPTGLAKILIDEEKRLRGRTVGNTGFGNAAIGLTTKNAEDAKTIAALTAQLAALQASAAHSRSASLVTKTCTDCNTKFDTAFHANTECKQCYELKKAKAKAAADAAKGAGGGRGGVKWGRNK